MFMRSATEPVPADGEEDLLQRSVLLSYTKLTKQRTFWSSQLIISQIFGSTDFSLQYAGLLLGALSLSLGEDEEVLKIGLRKGAFDFLVNSRDEALRILKNEARLGRPVSVALCAAPGQELTELRKRGLKPAIIAEPDGSGRLSVLAGVQVEQESVSDTGGTGSALYRFDFEGFEERRRFDEEAVGKLRAGDDAGRRWLALAGRVLPRVRPVQRFLYLDPEERERLATCSQVVANTC